MDHDPLWALRWAKRALIAVAVLIGLLLLLVLAYFLLPVKPPQFQLEVRYPGMMRVGDEILGEGHVELDDATLRRLALRVPAGTNEEQIGEMLHPGAKPRVNLGHFGDTGDSNGMVIEVGETVFAYRLFSFQEGQDLLVLPMQFENEGPKAATYKGRRRALTIALRWPPSKQQTWHTTVFLDVREMPKPGEDTVQMEWGYIFIR
jgi:hypothetical protein